MNGSELDTLTRFSSVEEAIGTLNPIDPIYCLFPAKFEAAVKRFRDGFHGTAMYAVKSNPEPKVLELLHRSGVNDFDTASLGEIKLIKGMFPDAHCHFMAPLRFPGHAKAAYFEYGVKDYVVDCDEELDKLIEETGNPGDLRIFVRLATSLGGALLELSSKFGTTTEDAARLLKRIAGFGELPCLTFHVGSQCLSSFSYAQAIDKVRRTVELAGVEIQALDIGGGFPAPYDNFDLPSYVWYFDTIREALNTLGRPDMPVYCEPGRAFCAEGVSVVTRVNLRRGDKLYLNDGVYGSFDELTLPGFDAGYPPTQYRPGANGALEERTDRSHGFRIYGPTCDTLDVFPKPVMLADDIAIGDYIVFGSCGAYTIAVRTPFNGFYPDTWVVIED